MVMSKVCDVRMRMNEKKKIGIDYGMAYATMFTFTTNVLKKITILLQTYNSF